MVYDNDSYVPYFPQGLAYIAAVLRENGIEIFQTLWDSEKNNLL